MFGSCISYDLPVMDSFIEFDVSEEVTEDIKIFFDIKLSPISTYLNALFKFLLISHLSLYLFNIPCKMGYNHSNYLPGVALLLIFGSLDYHLLPFFCLLILLLIIEILLEE